MEPSLDTSSPSESNPSDGSHPGMRQLPPALPPLHMPLAAGSPFCSIELPAAPPAASAPPPGAVPPTARADGVGAPVALDGEPCSRLCNCDEMCAPGRGCAPSRLEPPESCVRSDTSDGGDCERLPPRLLPSPMPQMPLPLVVLSADEPMAGESPPPPPLAPMLKPAPPSAPPMEPVPLVPHPPHAPPPTAPLPTAPPTAQLERTFTGNAGLLEGAAKLLPAAPVNGAPSPSSPPMLSGEKLMLTLGSSARKPCCQSSVCLATGSPSSLIAEKGSMSEMEAPEGGSSSSAATSLKKRANRDCSGSGSSSPSSETMPLSSASKPLSDHGSASEPVGHTAIAASAAGSSAAMGTGREIGELAETSAEEIAEHDPTACAPAELGAQALGTKLEPTAAALPGVGHWEAFGPAECVAFGTLLPSKPGTVDRAARPRFCPIATLPTLRGGAAAGGSTGTSRRIGAAACRTGGSQAVGGGSRLARATSNCSSLSCIAVPPTPSKSGDDADTRTGGAAIGANVALSVRPSSTTPSTARIACSASSRVAYAIVQLLEGGPDAVLLAGLSWTLSILPYCPKYSLRRMISSFATRGESPVT
mmetsp:Transcript_33202/g.70940  ORF Transcript_33202/g.70940 Transcript_33202/m.70940 type:complete len:590 (-) Transcript_33202:665-2434(-)